MSESPNIYQRMLGVMKDISYVQKSDKKVNDQYRFVTHDSVTAMVRGALLTHGIVATTDITAHGQDGNRTWADVKVSFVNVDNPPDRVEINAFGYGIDPQDKGPGKAVSYAVKYAYLKAFALETGDDPERDNIDHKPDVAAKIAAANISGRSAMEEEFVRMSSEEQDFIRSHAKEVERLFASKGDVFGYVEGQHFDQEEKMALAYLLPSNIRTALKKAREEMKPQKEAA